MSAYGIDGPREEVARSADEAVRVARAIGYPVVLKVLSADVQHKTEIGGVRLGLAAEVDVRDALDELVAAARDHYPDSPVAGVLVQEMVGDDAVEVIVGVLQDADFGPVVLFGSGGVLVELFGDSSLRLPPLSRREAREMITETRTGRLLSSFRGRPAADVAPAGVEACHAVRRVGETDTRVGIGKAVAPSNVVIPISTGAWRVAARTISFSMAAMNGSLAYSPDSSSAA